MFSSKTLVVIALALSACALAPAHAAGFADVLDTPSRVSSLATRGLMQAVAVAGDRVVAVGQRGHVVVSQDGGATWKQSRVPVSSDLTAVQFVDAKLGWAVGHDGVILNTTDGGDSWTLQLDGRRANDELVAAMERKVGAEPGSERAKALLAEAKRYREQGADKPFLDVWFADARQGYAVGAYNLIVRTDDGGRTWEPWFDRTDNPKLYNLYAIRPAAGALFVVGEGGLVLKLDLAAQRFKAVPIDYKGSFFGVADAGGTVLAFGLRGTIFRSDDAGAGWTKVDAGLAASIVGATRTAQGATILGDQGGRVARSLDGGRTFTVQTLTPAMPLSGIASLGDGRIAVAGPRGVTIATPSGR